MTQLTIQLKDKTFHRIQKAAKQLGKPTEVLVREWIERFGEENENNLDRDPFYQFEGFDSEASSDLSVNVDKYLYENHC